MCMLLDLYSSLYSVFYLMYTNYFLFGSYKKNRHPGKISQPDTENRCGLILRALDI